MPKIEIIAQGLVEAIALFNGARLRWQEKLEKTAQRFGEYALAYLQKRFRTGGTTETRTRVRSGRLRRAYSFLVTASTQAVAIALGVIRPDDEAAVGTYAAVQEYGAEVRPKNGQYLAIPLDAALTPSGIPRGAPRDFEDTFFVRLNRGEGLLLVQKQGTRNVPLFLLAKSVRVRPRPSLQPTAEALRPRFEAEALDDLRETIGGRRVAA